MSTTTNRLARKARDIVEQDAKEAQVLLNDAFKSRAYLYPLKGIYYLLSHRDLQRPLLKKVTPAASTAATVTAAMFAVTYLPQVAVLTFVNGPLAVFSTIFLVLTESATITGLISRGFFMQETLVDVFDGVSCSVEYWGPQSDCVSRPFFYMIRAILSPKVVLSHLDRQQTLFLG